MERSVPLIVDCVVVVHGKEIRVVVVQEREIYVLVV